MVEEKGKRERAWKRVVCASWTLCRTLKTLPNARLRPSSSSSSLSLSLPLIMEAALKSKAWPEKTTVSVHQQPTEVGFLCDDVAWALEKAGFVGVDELWVDDLFDFDEEDDNGGGEDEVLVVEEMETENSSDVSSEPPQPPMVTTTEIALPAIDAAELEWVSRIMDDSFSEFPQNLPIKTGLRQSPAVTTTSTSTGGGSGGGGGGGSGFCLLSTESLAPSKAKRSKRSRTVRLARPFDHFSFTDSGSSSSSSSSFSNTSSSCLIYDLPASAAARGLGFLLSSGSSPEPSRPEKQPKKRGRKPKQVSAPSSGLSGERRCSHCGAQKTPQWRAGPMGAKTLCNACGVRFKSGRLLPEYRPACSPTFLTDVHSNSHRKVMEMRRQKEIVSSDVSATAASPPPLASF